MMLCCFIKWFHLWQWSPERACTWIKLHGQHKPRLRPHKNSHDTLSPCWRPTTDNHALHLAMLNNITASCEQRPWCEATSPCDGVLAKYQTYGTIEIHPTQQMPATEASNQVTCCRLDVLSLCRRRKACANCDLEVKTAACCFHMKCFQLEL